LLLRNLSIIDAQKHLLLWVWERIVQIIREVVFWKPQLTLKEKTGDLQSEDRLNNT
jgi:hypothetical protein